MGEYVLALKASDLADGAMRKVSLRGHDLVVTNVGGRFYAADDRCPHLGASLSRGRLEGTTVVCPSHHSRFDLSDGRVLAWTDWTGWRARLAQRLRSPRPLVTHPVKVESGTVWIDLPSPVKTD